MKPLRKIQSNHYQSLMVNIPKDVAQEIGINAGDTVEITHSKAKQSVTFTVVKKTKEN